MGRSGRVGLVWRNGVVVVDDDEWDGVTAGDLPNTALDPRAKTLVLPGPAAPISPSKLF